MALKLELKKKKKKKKKQKVIYLSYREMQRILYEFMKRHIGEKKAVSRGEIFTELFGDPNNYEDLEVYYLWHKAKRAMNWIRRTTRMFIVSRRDTSGNWRFYVAKTQKDAKPYIDLLNQLKRRTSYMIKRCEEAVDQQWWREL